MLDKPISIPVINVFNWAKQGNAFTFNNAKTYKQHFNIDNTSLSKCILETGFTYGLLTGRKNIDALLDNDVELGEKKVKEWFSKTM